MDDAAAFRFTPKLSYEDISFIFIARVCQFRTSETKRPRSQTQNLHIYLCGLLNLSSVKPVALLNVHHIKYYVNTAVRVTQTANELSIRQR